MIGCPGGGGDTHILRGDILSYETLSVGAAGPRTGCLADNGTHSPICDTRHWFGHVHRTTRTIIVGSQWQPIKTKTFPLDFISKAYH